MQPRRAFAVRWNSSGALLLFLALLGVDARAAVPSAEVVQQIAAAAEANVPVGMSLVPAARGANTSIAAERTDAPPGYASAGLTVFEARALPTVILKTIQQRV